MGAVEDLYTYLVAASTRLEAGNVFINVVPNSTRATLSLLETGGVAPQQTYGSGNLPAFERARVQLLARTTAPAGDATVPYSTTARSLIHAAWVELNEVVNTTLSGSTFLRCDPVQSPFMLPGQENDGRLMFSCSFDVWRRPSTAYE